MAGGISILLILIVLLVGAAIAVFLYGTSAGVQMRADRRARRAPKRRPINTRVADDGADRGEPR
jgi:branched-subunit amino acid ABC-type transport system permease component